MFYEVQRGELSYYILADPENVVLAAKNFYTSADFYTSESFLNKIYVGIKR